MRLDVETHEPRREIVVRLAPAMPDLMRERALEPQRIGVAERHRSRRAVRLPVAAVRIPRKPSVHEVGPREPRRRDLVRADVRQRVQQRRVHEVDVEVDRVRRQRRAVVVPVARLVDRAQERVAVARLDHRGLRKPAARRVVDRHVRDLGHLAAREHAVQQRRGVVAAVVLGNRRELVHRDHEVDVRALGRQAEEVDRVVDVVVARLERRDDRPVRAVDRRLGDLDAVRVDAQHRVDARLRRELAVERDARADERGVARDQRQRLRRILQALRDLDVRDRQIHRMCGASEAKPRDQCGAIDARGHTS